jgi:hypothetical protein
MTIVNVLTDPPEEMYEKATEWLVLKLKCQTFLIWNGHQKRAIMTIAFERRYSPDHIVKYVKREHAQRYV